MARVNGDSLIIFIGNKMMYFNLPATKAGEPGRKVGLTLGGHPGQTAVARPLVWVTLAFMAGLVLSAWKVCLPPFWLAAGVLGLWTILALAWIFRWPVVFLPLVFFVLLGMAFYTQARQPFFPPQHLVHLPLDQDLTLQGRLHRPAKMGSSQVQLFLEVESRRAPDGWRPACGRLLVAAPLGEAPPVGTALVVRGRLAEPRRLNNPGAMDRPRQLAADGIFRVLRLKGPEHLLVLAGAGAPPLGERLRGSIRERLRDLPPGPRAIYLAMLLGDQGEITPEMRQNFSRTGTSHLLVINGLHLSAVAAVVYFLSFWGLRRFPRLLLRLNAVKVSTLLAAGPVVAYAWVAGGSPSTQRAEIMVLAYLLLVFLGRPREVWSALALAALAILCLSPLRLFAVSFQLSFVAVAALIYFLSGFFPGSERQEGAAGHRGLWDWSPWRERLSRWCRRLWRYGREALAVSVVATLATAPLVAAYFQVVSLGGILVNLAAIPLMLVVALPLGEAAVLAQGLSLTWVAQWLLFLGKFPVELGYAAIAGAARLPGSAVILPTPTWLQIGAYYLLLALLFPRWRSVWTWAGAGLAGLVLLGSVVFPWQFHPGVLEVTCLDHSRGLAGLVVSPEDRRLAFLAPGSSWPGQHPGAAASALPAYLHWCQMRRLDQVVALHLSQSNATEVLGLVRQFNVGSCWYGRRGPEGPAYWDLWNLLGDQGRTPRSLERGRPPVALGSVKVAFVNLGSEPNWAMRLEHQGRSLMILPPRPSSVQELIRPADLTLETLVLPEELACRPEGAAFLARLQPRRLVLYGAPRQSRPLTEMAVGIPCWRTREGAVSLYLGPEGLTVRQWRP